MRDLQDCLPYVRHLRVQHRRLNEALQRIGETFLEKDIEAPARLVNGLAELRQDLAHHFAEEEEGGCLEEAVSRCPSLSADVRHVEEQHAVLLSELDDVIDDARQEQGDSAKGAPLLQEFGRFAESLRRHESAENRILQLGFGGEADLGE
jgi:hypothetical protein